MVLLGGGVQFAAIDAHLLGRSDLVAMFSPCSLVTTVSPAILATT